MTPDEYSDVRQLYKFAIAYDAFTAISEACEHLIAAGTESSAPEYYAMAVGIVTIYGRPFTNNARGIGMISTKLVPTEFKDLHSELIELRNKAFAHTDSAFQAIMFQSTLRSPLQRLFHFTPALSLSHRPAHLKPLPGFLASTVDTVRSVRKLHQVVRQTGAMVVTGHDPDAWPKFKQSPEYYE